MRGIFDNSPFHARLAVANEGKPAAILSSASFVGIAVAVVTKPYPDASGSNVNASENAARHSYHYYHALAIARYNDA